MTTAQQTPGEPADLDALLTLAVRQHQAGRLEEAATAYRRILAARPNVAALHNNLGTVLCQLERFDEALPQFLQAIALEPNLADAHNNLANLLRQRGQLDAAAAEYRQVVALRPTDAAALNALATVLRQQGKFAEAESHYRRVLDIRPNSADGHNNLGIVLAQQERFDEAIAHYRQALANRPEMSTAHNNLGNALHQKGKFDQAAAAYRQALTIEPNYPEAHFNLGTTLWDLGQLAEAEAHCRQALALRPDFARACDKLGCLLREQNKLDEARRVFERLAAIQPDPPNAEFGLAICDLLAGNYERGWQRFESRLRLPMLRPQIGLPRWMGEDLAGRSLLVLAEQGLGDTLLFLRYLRPLKARGPRILLAVQPALGRLLAGGSDWDELYTLDSPESPQADFYLPLLSAPYALSLPVLSDVPYLAADPALRESWGEELSQGEGFRIGLAWQGSPGYRADRQRSIPLTDFAPLAKLPGVRLVSLQKGFGSEQTATVDFPLLDLSSRLDEAAGPFMDTAAVIANLDLVVAADTAIAHLAGSLGVPVFLALQRFADWRWQRGRDDSPWYPTMRLFRQSAVGDWPGVFQRIAAAVAELRENRSSEKDHGA